MNAYKIYIVYRYIIIYVFTYTRVLDTIYARRVYISVSDIDCANTLVYMCVRARACIYIYTHTHTHIYIYIHTHTYIHIYIYMYICIYVYMYIYIAAFTRVQRY